MDRKNSLWNICGPYFNGKASTEGKNAIVSDDETIASIFNEHFCNITRSLPIQNTVYIR